MLSRNPGLPTQAIEDALRVLTVYDVSRSMPTLPGEGPVNHSTGWYHIAVVDFGLADPKEMVFAFDMNIALATSLSIVSVPISGNLRNKAIANAVNGVDQLWV